MHSRVHILHSDLVPIHRASIPDTLNRSVTCPLLMPDSTQTCTRVDASTHRVRGPLRVYAQDKGETSSDIFMTLAYVCTTRGGEPRYPNSPLPKTYHESTPLVPHFTKAPKPCTQLVLSPHLFLCMQALYTCTLPPWSDSVHINPTLRTSPHTLGVGEANSAERMAKDYTVLS